MLLPLAETLPLRVAPVSKRSNAARVAAAGAGGEATKARLCEAPPSTAMMCSPGMMEVMLDKTGTLRFVVLPSPNWPEEFKPQAARVPSEQRAKPCVLPVPIAVTVLPASTPALLTDTGALLLLVL